VTARRSRHSRLRSTLLAAALLFPAIGCHQSEAPPVEATRTAAPKEVVVVRAALQPWPRTVRVQGSLLAHEDATIGSKLAGRVDSVAVDLGSVINTGDTLVTLDRSELDLRVQLAEANLRQACAAIGLTPDGDENQVDHKNSPRVELEQALVEEAQAAVTRGKQLLPTRAITGAEFDTMVAQLKAAQARYDSAVNAVAEQVSLIGVRRKELALAQQAVIDATIIAPFDGIIEERRVSPGEYVQVGQPVVTLVRTDRLRFTAGVPESKAGPIESGQRVEIRIAGQQEPVTAVISRVSPTVTLTSRAVRVEADVTNPDLQLQAGLFAEADVIVDPDDQTLAVPVTAVSRFAGVQKVWLVANGTARQQTVRAGREADGRVEILEGLEAGETVVAKSADGHDGPVIAVEKPTAARLQVNASDKADQVEL
jgi:RND family efflux transporter MFP subunit